MWPFLEVLLFCALAIFFSLPSLAQDTEINRYTVYTGFDYMLSPARNLTERGFDVDFGVTVKPWFALGGDVSAIGDNIISGAGTINGSETVYAPTVGAVGIPPSSIHVPFRSTTYTFAAGPQFYWRKWRKITFLGRPGFGGIHESANLNFPPQLGPLFTELGIPIPSSHQTDTTWFIGLGGGFRPQREPSRRTTVYCRLGEHSPVLRSTDQPAKLRQVHRRPHISLGPSVVGAQPRF